MTTIDTTYNGAIPSFPQVLNADIEYTGIKVLVDLSAMASLGKMEGVQTIYVDLNNYDFDVHIVMPDSQQRITAKANTQGYYPVLATSLMKFEITSDGNGNFPIKFINFPIALGVWGFNEIQGEKGKDGLNGGNIETINSDSSEGVEIAQVQPELIILKKLIAGDNIEIDDTGTALIINSTASGGGGDGGGSGGGGGELPFLRLHVWGSEDETPLPKIQDSMPIDFSLYTYQIDKVGESINFNSVNNMIEINAAGVYQINFNYSSNVTTGNNFFQVFGDVFDPDNSNGNPFFGMPVIAFNNGMQDIALSGTISFIYKVANNDKLSFVFGNLLNDATMFDAFITVSKLGLSAIPDAPVVA